MDNKTILVSHQILKNFSIHVLERVGVSTNDADFVADTLVWADLRGIHSHGCIRLPVYIRRIMNGEIKASPTISIIHDTQATMLLDGDNGLGQVISRRAMNCAIERAVQYGTSFVGVRGSNHFGTNAYYAALALPYNMIGMVLTISNLNTMAPWGGLDLLLGNNPIAFAIPADKEYPVLFDSALSVAAKAKILMAKELGKETIPAGWALDKDGKPTTNTEEALEGILIPIGGYKGIGLSFVISLLSGVLLNAAYGKGVSDTNVGHLFCAINVSMFQDIATFTKNVDHAIQELHLSRRSEGIPEILVPGERGYRTHQQQLQNGIPFSEKIIGDLHSLAQELGLDYRIE